MDRPRVRAATLGEIQDIVKKNKKLKVRAPAILSMALQTVQRLGSLEKT